MSSTLDLITDALQNIGVVGLNDSEAHAEDLAVGLRKFNARGSLWNTRERFKKFERMQTFPVIASQQSYTIGIAADTPDFIVAAGKAPVKITRANWLVGTGDTQQSWPIEIIQVAEYSELFMPAFTGIWAYGIYYQRTSGNAKIWPWPVPTDLVDALQLFWWDQFIPVLIADIALELGWPEGYELAFTLTLSEDLCLPFGKERSAHLKESAAQARTDIQSLNTAPPRLDTTGRSSPPGAGLGNCR